MSSNMCHTATYGVVSAVMVALLQWQFGHDPISAGTTTAVAYAPRAAAAVVGGAPGDQAILEGQPAAADNSGDSGTYSDSAGRSDGFRLVDVVALGLDSFASFLLVDASVVLMALGAIVATAFTAVAAAVALFSLHGQARQAIRAVFKSSRWVLALLTISMLLRVDTATLLVSPISSIFWLGLAWTWRSGIVLLAVAVNYIFRAMIIRALILPGSAPTVVKKMIVPSETVQYLKQETSSMRARGWEHESRIIPSGCQGIALDVRTLRVTSSPDAFWFLYFLGNMGSVEGIACDVEQLALELGVNVAAFHYRGTTPYGDASNESDKDSETAPPGLRQPMTAADLVEDGCAIVRYLEREYGIDPVRRLVLYGQSIGGAVAAAVRCKFPGGILVSDRSFSRLADVPIAPVHSKLSPWLLKLIATVLRFLVDTIGWSMDAMELWPELERSGVDRIVVYTREDEIIGYDFASLHAALCRRKEAATKPSLDGANTSKSNGVEYRFEAVVNRRSSDHDPTDGHVVDSDDQDGGDDSTGISPHNSRLQSLDPVCYANVLHALRECMNRQRSRQ